MTISPAIKTFCLATAFAAVMGGVSYLKDSPQDLQKNYKSLSVEDAQSLSVDTAKGVATFSWIGAAGFIGVFGLFKPKV